jgi:hypothetical protein
MDFIFCQFFNMNLNKNNMKKILIKFEDIFEDFFKNNPRIF